MLRKHQSEFNDTTTGIISGSGINTIYGDITPGGGKSILPVIAGRLIPAGLADKLMWIAPRLSLIDQAEREFINPYFREMLGHRLTIRSSTNERNPSRGTAGFATTYQAVGLDEGILLDEFRRHRYILVLDEFHHVQKGSLWHKKIEPLWNHAVYRVAMTGTLERGDGDQIAFLPYNHNGYGLVPSLKNTDDTAVIRYTRADALAEKAIIPLSFHLSDGSAKWQEKTGKEKQVASMERMDARNQDMASKALYTALRTEYAEELLDAGLAHWMQHRKQVPGAKCLIVASDIGQAKQYMASIKKRKYSSIRMAIATSEDSAAALKVINAMKRNGMDLLVTVAMAYEGLSIEAISHIICLTNIRSAPWIEQMTARANRIDKGAGPYDTQMGYIFAPADPLFREIVAQIEAEQAPVLEDRKKKARQERERSSSEPGFGLTSPGGIKPLSSSLTGNREVLLTGDHKISDHREPIMTPSEKEADILKQIETHIRTWAYRNRYNPKKLNAEIFQHFGKPRREMTVSELIACLSYVKQTYNMDKIRGTGQQRVPSKASPYTVKRLMQDSLTRMRRGI